MSRRLKVLMSAYACEPGRGSEPEVGWQWALQMAQVHDVTVVTRTNNRPAIEAALPTAPEPHPKFRYFDLPDWALRFKRRGWLPVAIYYLLWQAGVRRHLAGRLTEFDLIHHVTFNSFRQPGFWWCCGRPVVLGPLGGGQVCPWRMWLRFGRWMLPEGLRSLSVLTTPLWPHLHLSWQAATRILVANRDTARRLPPWQQHKVRLLLETGIESRQVLPPRPRADGWPVKFLWISRLERIKACALALEAFAHARHAEPRLSLSLVGDGPDAPHARAVAARLGLGEAVHWYGRLPRENIPAVLQEHDVFVFTSVRDTSGNVLLEAMAAGLPAVTLLHHGAAEIATDQTAIRTPPGGFRQTAVALGEAMLRLARSPELRARLGEAARARVLEVYVWERKRAQMDAIYQEAAASRG